MKITADITAPELVAGYDAAFVHKDFRPDMHAIWDLSSLRLVSIPVSEIRKLPPELRDYARKRGDYKAALVPGSATDRMLLRLYLTILKLIGTNIRFRICNTLADAYQWIEENR
ncbi:MAG: hypothetical protein JJ934_06675 [Pseudomonadales bacterium]|nr:hypothetical protein [Pseudomonadales bacterium]MBO6701258.1 hypothetical protein [Pseudomonadales bacterium]MBO6821688.1 hypothetical protein [Pseudomonadales bacterium]